MNEATHEVFNQSTPLTDINLFTSNRALQDALAFNAPMHDRARFVEMGAEFGSAAMQEHARLANFHPPRLETHDRYGRRIDQVEFHPSYHVLLAAALRHGLHGRRGGSEPAPTSSAPRASCSSPNWSRRCCARCP